MALIDNRKHRLILLPALYVAQGMPWGFMTIALISYLAERGIGDTQAGKLVGLALLPWTFKIVWAPLIDTVTIRSMGRRRSWIIGAEFLMAVSLLGFLTMGDLTGNLRLLGWMFFIHNCFASLQDVSTDALALDIVPPNEQGRTNGLMWGSKMVGKAIGGAGLAIVIDAWGLTAAVFVQLAVLLLIMLFPLLMVEKPGDRRLPWSRPVGSDDSRQTTGENFRSFDKVVVDLLRSFSLRTTAVFLIFGVMHVAAQGIVEIVTKTLYTQQLKWSFVEVSQVAGLAVFVEMLGALGGGYLADRLGHRKVIATGLGGYGLLAIVFAIFPENWSTSWFAAGYLFLNPGILAFGIVGFFAMAMRLSWTKSAATMFTIYLTTANIGHVAGNWLVGPLRDEMGFSYEQTFLFAGLIAILPLLLLFLVKSKDVDLVRDT